jgi:hypothetical protein
MNPNYPIYIISKGRWDTRFTSKEFEKLKVPYKIVIEPQEYDKYAEVIDPKKILILPFSNLNQGSIPARNWVWEHSIKSGAERHWIIDDNIRYFRRCIDGKRLYVNDGTIFKAAEDFIDRYENIKMAGFQYQTFAIEYKKPIQLNTRIYSCILLANDIPHRWRGKYNEDTDLSIRILKDGYVTCLFYAFLCDKCATMTIKGGNTESLYKLNNEDGRLLMAQSLYKQHPEIVKIKRRWGRWQHIVDYSKFRKNKPILKKGIILKNNTNNYNMKIVQNKEKQL